jgi:hypothetical protein
VSTTRRSPPATDAMAAWYGERRKQHTVWRLETGTARGLATSIRRREMETELYKGFAIWGHAIAQDGQYAASGTRGGAVVEASGPQPKHQLIHQPIDGRHNEQAQHRRHQQCREWSMVGLGARKLENRIHTNVRAV